MDTLATCALIKVERNRTNADKPAVLNLKNLTFCRNCSAANNVLFVVECYSTRLKHP